jgi:LuxR family transcriptional regulator
MSSMRELNGLLGQLKAAAPGGYAVGLHIRFAAPLITAHTYPEEWLRIYTSRAYALRDPLIFWGLSCEGTTRWSEIELPDPFDIFRQAREFGLNFGCAVACGPLTSRTIVGAARADREFEDAEIARFQAIVWRMHEIAEPPEELTKAQVEALKCIADGDRHIAELMHRDPAARRCIVLVILHPVGLGQIPLVMLDERFVSGAKHVREKLAVVVHVAKGKGRHLHGSLLLG